MAPALCGPTLSSPSLSNQAIEPPPAPTVWMSTIGRRIGKSATWRSKPDRGAAAPDQRDVGAGPAHVEGDHVRRARRGAATSTAPIAPAAGPESAVRIGRSAGARERHQPAARLVDADLGPGQPLRQRRLEPRQIARHHRLQIGVQRGGREALVLAELRLHLGRQRQMEPGQGRAQRSRDRLLVRRVEVAEQEADAQASAPDAAAPPRPPPPAPPASIGRCTEPSARIRSAELEAALARHERRREVGVEVVHVRADLAADLEQVAKASVVTSATRPPLRWISALVPTVVPCASRRTSSPERPASPAKASIPSTIARPGSSGVDGRLCSQTAPLASSSAIEVGERPADVHPDRPAQDASREDRQRSQ